jgi:hypothetical protein
LRAAMGSGVRRIGLMAVMASLALVVALPAQAADGVRLKVAMNGRQVVGGGDPDGAGGGRLVAYPHQGRLCYSFAAKRIYYAWSVQLVRGARGSNGWTMLELRYPGWDSSWSGCETNVDAGLLADLAQNPGGYYINVSTCEHWFGAIRGQLSFSR